VIGLIAAAVGLERGEVPALVRLHQGLAVGVRVDRRGSRGVDFHTTEEVPTADGRTRGNPVVSRRSYLYDASFAVVLTERDGLEPSLEALLEALRYPRFPLYLGRRACVPGVPVLAVPGLLEGADWLEVLAKVPLSDPHDGGPLEVYLEGDVATAERLRTLRLRDELVGPLPRIFAERMVTHSRLEEVVEARDTVDTWFPK
jgi:CRISPR system Cascade subunit CasD